MEDQLVSPNAVYIVVTMLITITVLFIWAIRRIDSNLKQTKLGVISNEDCKSLRKLAAEPLEAWGKEHRIDWKEVIEDLDGRQRKQRNAQEHKGGTGVGKRPGRT